MLRVSVARPNIVDRNGNYYGRFSINIYSGFDQSSFLKEIYEFHDGELDDVRDALCDAFN